MSVLVLRSNLVCLYKPLANQYPDHIVCSFPWCYKELVVDIYCNRISFHLFPVALGVQIRYMIFDVNDVFP